LQKFFSRQGGSVRPGVGHTFRPFCLRHIHEAQQSVGNFLNRRRLDLDRSTSDSLRLGWVPTDK
jgi:hypothetical protein